MLISIIIPVYYNAESLPILFERLNKVSEKIVKNNFEFIFVDDGSGDDSFQILLDLAKKDSRIKIIKLTRNFGSFTAILAGMTYAKGNCAVIMAADLQDPPELINDFYKKWKEGNEIVYAIRSQRQEKIINLFLSNLFYCIFRLIALKNMPKQGFDFVMMGKRAMTLLTTSQEKNSSLMGQLLWAGFKTDHIMYTKEGRPFGHSRWSFWKKVKYSLDSIMAFSYFPIRIASFLGVGFALMGFLFAIYAVLKKLIFGISVQGFTMLLVMLLLTSGFQMILLGIIGEYLWRTLDETRKRPSFIVDKLVINKKVKYGNGNKSN